MISLNIQQHRKVRVWTDEMPDCKYDVAQVVEQIVEARPFQHGDVRHLAIESLMLRGGRIHYGLLGATFTPNTSNQLVIQIVVSGIGTQRVFGDALAAHLDDVRVGLPFEYIDGVSAGILASDNIHNLGSGILYIGWAAHGRVGSSRSVFGRLSSDILQLLGTGTPFSSNEELAGMLHN